MKFKKIMLITFILLAILTIGAASAADDVASDDIAVSDDVDEVSLDSSVEEETVGEMTSDDVSIDVDEEVSKEDPSHNFTNVEVSEKEGNFVICTGEGGDTVEVYRQDLSQSDDYYEDDDGAYHFGVSLNDINGYIASNINPEKNFYDIVQPDQTLRFVLEYQGSVLTSQEYRVDFNDENITFNEIEKEFDAIFYVHDVMFDAFDENFTEVAVADRNVIFAIYAEGDDDDIKLFAENLATTNRAYEGIEIDGITFYKFAFTFNDVNAYIAEHFDGKSFADLVEDETVVDESEIYFVIEDDEGLKEYSETWIISLNPDGYIFDIEEEEEDIGEYGDLDVIMYDDDEWKNEVVIDFKVEKGTDATICIYLNDNETAAFQKDLSAMEYVEDDEDENFIHYNVTVGDLNIDKAGEYVLRIYLTNETDTIWEYDDEEPETLVLYEAQVAENENATIEATPITTAVGDDAIIEIYALNNESDVVIYVDDSETPITKKLKEFYQDEYGTYLITAKDLGLGVGEHKLNITYMGANLIATVNLVSKVEIYLPEEDEIVNTGDDFEDSFVDIRLDDDKDIYESGIGGMINVTIYDEDGNVVDTLQKDIRELYYHDGPRAYVVRVNDLKSQLNGTYWVTVRYFDGNEAPTEESSWVQFKLFDPADYGTSIKNTITDEDDSVITFKDLPPADVVLVKVDGIETEIDEWDLFHHRDDEGLFCIGLDELNGLDEGTHLVVVGIEVNDTFKELARANVIVDLEENYDLALAISIADIQEGNAANIVITTNNTFTGAISVQIGTSNYTVNVIKGQGSLQVTGLAANTYTATAIFKNDGVFNDTTKTATFKVTAKPAAPAAPAKKVIKLTLKKVKVKKSAKKLVLQATLKINGKAPKKGTKITFTFKGKKYVGKTNAKGVAKVTIKKKVLKKLKVGKKVKYTAKYSTKTVKRTVKVKR